MNKICTKCKIEKDGSLFFKNARSKDKLQSWCKVCHKVANQTTAKYRLQNGYKFDRVDKVCAKCNNRKPIGQFYQKRGYSADGYGSYCKPCWVIITQKSQERNKNK